MKKSNNYNDTYGFHANLVGINGFFNTGIYHQQSNQTERQSKRGGNNNEICNIVTVYGS